MSKPDPGTSVFTFRQVVPADIPVLHEIRTSVRENVLSDPGRITTDDYLEMTLHRGTGWVGLRDGRIAGFAILDLREANVWALFVHPENEGLGLGRHLHRLMMDHAFRTGLPKIWLSTAPGTRAERFYRRAGWTDTGSTDTGEILFDMTASRWGTLNTKREPRRPARTPP